MFLISPLKSIAKSISLSLNDLAKSRACQILIRLSGFSFHGALKGITSSKNSMFFVKYLKKCYGYEFKFFLQNFVWFTYFHGGLVTKNQVKKFENLEWARHKTMFVHFIRGRVKILQKVATWYVYGLDSWSFSTVLWYPAKGN